MTDRACVLFAVALVGAAGCWALLTVPRSEASAVWARVRQSMRRSLRVEPARIALVQADLDWPTVRLWIGGRLIGAGVAAVLAYTIFHLWVLAGLTLVAAYQLAGWGLERRRRRVQLARHRALLEAVRYGAAVMSRAGNAQQMLRALADHGPWEARRLFGQILEAVQQTGGATSLAEAVEQTQQRLGDPMFDDIALALTLHERRGSRLVPALETVATDWDQTLALQREAKALRAGVEASVLILTVLPFAFLTCLQLLAPALLEPFRTPLGEIVFGAAAVWMALGYRVLQTMSAPPKEERGIFTLAAKP